MHCGEGNHKTKWILFNSKDVLFKVSGHEICTLSITSYLNWRVLYFLHFKCVYDPHCEVADEKEGNNLASRL